MDLDSFFRKNVFFIIDFLKGGNVTKHYNEIKKSYYLGEDDNNTNNKLKRLLNHASRTTSYYSNLKSCNDINSFPVVNKITYIENYEDFFSQLYKNKKLGDDSSLLVMMNC